MIKADSAPNKVVPAPQSTGNAPKGVIYDRAEKPQGERVVSREEQPIEMREAQALRAEPVVPGAAPPPAAAGNAAGAAPMRRPQ